MSNPVRDAIHFRRLLQIKERPNQYPSYTYKKRNDLKKSSSLIKIRELTSEIKINNKNISFIKKSFSKKKPPNYFDDKYLYNREVENVQKQMLDSLINKNKNLKMKLKNMKESFSFLFQTSSKKSEKQSQNED